MTRYSHSRLSTFEQCRYKYKLECTDCDDNMELSKVVEKSPTEAYRSLGELRQLDFVEVTDTRFKRTDTGRIARL